MNLKKIATVLVIGFLLNGGIAFAQTTDTASPAELADWSKSMEAMVKAADPTPYIQMMTDPRIMNALMKMMDPTPYLQWMTDPAMMDAMMKMADPRIWGGMMNAMIQMMNVMPQAMSGFSWPAPAPATEAKKTE